MRHDAEKTPSATAVAVDARTDVQTDIDSDSAGPGIAETEPASDAKRRQRFLPAVWNAITGVLAAVMGLLPHVLHHIGLFAGAFLVTGVTGNLVFGALGLVLSIPLLRRLYRRFATWKAPAVAVAVFAVMFAITAFVVGPAISGTDHPTGPAPSGPVSPDEHARHHGG